MENSHSQLSYIVGENVICSIVDTVFPTGVGQEMTSPLDVACWETSTDDLRVSYMARLLQALDADDIPGNVISIDA